ncbi:hypothetical protein HYH02_001959 [Chlamydomonas schloesseri]|uniref:Hexosyltransferase n=1 Tax=Chlamydomonas schloesseri TaxID=2026947 RepID=A0A835WT66_9CHLO|nr:hypothetical protein HYH02_001959 [Chlamydomonas schloesseri]|eukprot:KAG2453748.1 hypothetical protein HYH02_001959 [Chlamydomonas schloesseri]
MECGGEASTSASDQPARVHIFICSAAKNADRRNSLRRSWFRYLTDADSPLPARFRPGVSVHFIISRESRCEEVDAEQTQHGDILYLDAPAGYHNLWRKALCFLAWLEEHTAAATASGSGRAGDAGSRLPDADPGGASASASSASTPAATAATASAAAAAAAAAATAASHDYDYVMHADDDSFVRLDLLLPMMASWPRQRHYWGYIWDGTGNRVTAPIRNPANKSHMPAEQYPLDYYPPFASGCGFVLSRDLVLALLSRPLPDYRLLDPPFGIHLCGPPQYCVVSGGPVAPVHEERVRPYRPLPTFRPDTLVQHYLRAEEMRPYWEQALEAARGGPAAAASDAAGAPQELYNTLVSLGLLRR